MHGLQEHERSYPSRDYHSHEEHSDCYAPEHDDAHGDEDNGNSGVVDFLASCLGDEHASLLTVVIQVVGQAGGKRLRLAATVAFRHQVGNIVLSADPAW
jgi:hypothetical protein